MIKGIRIISDGTAHGTQVLMPDGTRVPMVVEIEILPLRHGEDLRARLTVAVDELDVVADAQILKTQVG